MRIEVKVPDGRSVPELNLNFTSRLPPESTMVFMEVIVSFGFEELLLPQETTAAVKTVINMAGIRKDACFMMLI
jgi:hypothetical protein